MAEKGAPKPLEDGAALFLDIDGTLIEHQPHPDDVFVDDDLWRALRHAEKRLCGAVAFITGRSLGMVDRLFAPEKWPAAGLYGLEHRLHRGGEAELADEPEDLRAIIQALEAEFHTTQGVYFERKGPVLAIHTRAAPDAFARVLEASQNALPQLGERYRIIAGHAGLEFMPIDALKSAAIRRFCDIAPFAGRRAVFIGDDTSDETGFEHVNALGGVSIRVRPTGPTAAIFTLPDVAAVRRWIAG